MFIHVTTRLERMMRCWRTILVWWSLKHAGLMVRVGLRGWPKDYGFSVFTKHVSNFLCIIQGCMPMFILEAQALGEVECMSLNHVKRVIDVIRLSVVKFIC